MKLFIFIFIFFFYNIKTDIIKEKNETAQNKLSLKYGHPIIPDLPKDIFFINNLKKKVYYYLNMILFITSIAILNFTRIWSENSKNSCKK